MADSCPHGIRFPNFCSLCEPADYRNSAPTDATLIRAVIARMEHFVGRKLVHWEQVDAWKQTLKTAIGDK